MGDYTQKKKESGMHSALNMLIYDYLVKMKYEGAAKVFFAEAALGDFKPAEGSPLLAQWYGAFHDISAVRSGLSSNVRDLSRIEGIMMKLENEKRRHQSIGRADPMMYGMREMETYKPPMYYQHPQFEQRGMYDVYGQTSPTDQAPRFYNPRKDYRAMGHPGYPRFEDQMGAAKTPRQRDARFMGSPMAPKEEAKEMDPAAVRNKPFGLKEVMTFVPSEHRLVCSVIAREHRLMFAASADKSIAAVNLLSGKNEARVESGTQIVEMKVREYEDCVVVVCGLGTSELLLGKYSVKEKRFGALEMLSGHMAPVVSYEVLDFVHSLDSSGIMRRWSLQGVFEREEVVSGDVVHICCISKDNFLLADKQRVYVYDFELNIEMMEILRGEVLEIKRADEGFLVVFRSQVVWLDKRIEKVKALSIGEGIRTAALIDCDLVAASSHDAWFSTGKALNRMKLHEAGVVGLDSVNLFRKPSVVSSSANGECKVWIKYLGD